MNRREFIAWIGLGSVASSLPIALAACTPKTSTPSASSPETNSPATSPPATSPEASSSQTGGFQVAGTVADLDKNGQLNPPIADNKVLILRDPSQQIVAVNPTCTHAGCTVAWKADQKALVCPCHGSIFTSDGQVVKGPATRPLATYPVKTEGDEILVQV